MNLPGDLPAMSLSTGHWAIGVSAREMLNAQNCKGEEVIEVRVGNPPTVPIPVAPGSGGSVRDGRHGHDAVHAEHPGDDLDDGGAAHFAAVIRAIRARCPATATRSGMARCATATASWTAIRGVPYHWPSCSRA